MTEDELRERLIEAATKLLYRLGLDDMVDDEALAASADVIFTPVVEQYAAEL